MFIPHWECRRAALRFPPAPRKVSEGSFRTLAVAGQGKVWNSGLSSSSTDTSANIIPSCQHHPKLPTCSAGVGKWDIQDIGLWDVSKPMHMVCGRAHPTITPWTPFLKIRCKERVKYLAYTSSYSPTTAKMPFHPWNHRIFKVGKDL